MRKMFLWILRFPKLTILAIVVITAFFTFQMRNLRMETDPDIFISKDHPAIVYRDKVEDIFGVRDPILIGIENNGPDGVFNKTTLEKVDRITNRLKKMPGIDHGSVISLSTIDNIIGTEEGMVVTPFMEEVPKTDYEISNLRRAIYGNEMYAGFVVSMDRSATLIFAELKERAKEEKEGQKIYDELNKIVRDERGPEKIYIAGRPVMEGVVGILMKKDMSRLFPLVILVVLFVLFLTFRSIRGVTLPMMVVLISIIWTMGLMALLGVPTTIASSIMPIILMAIGVADGIHILSKYYDEATFTGRNDRKGIVLDTMLEMWPPVVMTSLTTAVGFLSMLSTQMPPVQEYGMFTSFGIISAMVFSLFFMPAVLVLLPLPSPKKMRKLESGGIANRFLSKLGEKIFQRRKIVAWSTLIMILLSALGIMIVRVDSSFVSMFPNHSRIVEANAFINKKFGGTTSLNVVLETDQKDGIKSSEVLMAIDKLQEYVMAEGEVGSSLSLADYIKRMNQVMNGDDTTYHRIPDSRDLIAQYLLLYSISGDPDDFDRVVDYDFKITNVNFQIRTDRTFTIQNILDRVKEFSNQHLKAIGVETNLAGSAVIGMLFNNFIVDGQKTSLILAVVFVFLLTMMMFRSPVAGVFNIIPVSVATLFNFGIMGLLGIPVDNVNAFMSGVALGIGVDYTIHFISKYRLQFRETGDPKTLTVITMVTSGKAIFFNAMVVILGFMVLLFSEIPPNLKMGLMVSVNMFTSFLGAMTVLPALLGIVKPKFIYGG